MVFPGRKDSICHLVAPTRFRRKHARYPVAISALELRGGPARACFLRGTAQTRVLGYVEKQLNKKIRPDFPCSPALLLFYFCDGVQRSVGVFFGGFGRVLFHAREHWPDYMSCVLVVRQDMIDQRPEAVQALVDGVARSGLWLEKGKPYRENAADFVGRFYYNQNPALLRWALTKPLDRVMYTPLAPRKPDFDLVRDLMIETGLLTQNIEFQEYTDLRFADHATIQTAWNYQPGSADRNNRRVRRSPGHSSCKRLCCGIGVLAGRNKLLGCPVRQSERRGT